MLPYPVIHYIVKYLKLFKVTGLLILTPNRRFPDFFSSDMIMTYRITNYTRKQGLKIGVVVKPSTKPDKKIDVFRNGEKIASVGAFGMNDYPTFIRKRGITFAKTRRKLYKQRHERDRHIKWSNGWLADKLLW